MSPAFRLHGGCGQRRAGARTGPRARRGRGGGAGAGGCGRPGEGRGDRRGVGAAGAGAGAAAAAACTARGARRGDARPMRSPPPTVAHCGGGTHLQAPPSFSPAPQGAGDRLPGAPARPHTRHERLLSAEAVPDASAAATDSYYVLCAPLGVRNRSGCCRARLGVVVWRAHWVFKDSRGMAQASAVRQDKGAPAARPPAARPSAAPGPGGAAGQGRAARTQRAAPGNRARPRGTRRRRPGPPRAGPPRRAASERRGPLRGAAPRLRTRRAPARARPAPSRTARVAPCATRRPPQHPSRPVWAAGTHRIHPARPCLTGRAPPHHRVGLHGLGARDTRASKDVAAASVWPRHQPCRAAFWRPRWVVNPSCRPRRPQQRRCSAACVPAARCRGARRSTRLSFPQPANGPSSSPSIVSVKKFTARQAGARRAPQGRTGRGAGAWPRQPPWACPPPRGAAATAAANARRAAAASGAATFCSLAPTSRSPCAWRVEACGPGRCNFQGPSGPSRPHLLLKYSREPWGVDEVVGGAVCGSVVQRE
jgi:hypothetical protein